VIIVAWVVAALAVAVAAVALALRARAGQGVADAVRRAEVAERRADSAEDRMRSSFQALPLVTIRVDDQGRVLDANRRARERFTFLESGMRILEAFSEHELAGRVDAALASQEADEFEVRLFAGGRRTYHVLIEPYRSSERAEALVALTDTSEAVAYQELRSQFVANVSHELRTPLTGLRGLLEALGDPEMDDETRTRFVERAAHETERLEALIRDILFLSELEATQGLPTEGRSDLGLAVAETVDELGPLAAEHGISLGYDATEGAFTPLTDRLARTVVRNLLENAAKYAGAGARAETVVKVDGDRVVLLVSDDGSGIPERHLPHVFERFYRADPSRSKQLGGTGLGLSIVKHIAERYGGRATASSREGFGTTVTVVLPASAPAAAARVREESHAEAAGPG
jgi:two-component system phosphate regulon sensor histidine kinase PhoR